MKMQKILFLILFLSINFSMNLYAQHDSTKLDSGHRLLKESLKYKDSDKAQAMLLLNQALDIFREENNLDGLAKTFLAISSYYLSENQWDTSLSLSLRALKYADNLGDNSIKATAYLNLGIIYYELKSYQTSEKYFRQAILYGNKKNKASAISNIGLIFSSR